MAKQVSKKTAFDYAHVKGVTAWALMHQSGGHQECPRAVPEYAGKIVCNFTPAACIMDVRIWAGPLNSWSDETVTSSEGGFGSDRFSGAFHHALRLMKNAPKELPNLRHRGEREVEKFLESHGYTVLKVV